MKARIYYANQLVEEFDGDNDIELARIKVGPEIYNGGYLRVVRCDRWGRFGEGWFRLDGTPLDESDVPKQTRLLDLILG